MPPKRQRKKLDANALERWLERAPLLSIVHWFILCGMAVALIPLASELRLHQVISDSLWHGTVFTIFGVLVLTYLLTGLRRRRRRPEDEQYYCEICHRVTNHLQRQRTLERFPDKHFEQLCQRCREIVFQQAAWSKQLKVISRGIFALLAIFSAACLANIALALFWPPPDPSLERLVEAELQVLRFQHDRKMLVAIYNQQEVSLYLPQDVDLRQQVKDAALQQGDFVTALVDDKRIVGLSKDGQPVFTFGQIEHEDNMAYIGMLILQGLFATVPLGWYLYWERPRMARVLKSYREKLDQYPEGLREQLKARMHTSDS